jgi:hypothetical protein
MHNIRSVNLNILQIKGCRRECDAVSQSLRFLCKTKVLLKGVGPSTTLAWPGWKQPDIPVEVDTARLNTSRFKKCYEKCVLLYYPSTEFKSAFNVY